MCFEPLTIEDEGLGLALCELGIGRRGRCLSLSLSRGHFPRARSYTSSRPTPCGPLGNAPRTPPDPCGRRRRRSGTSTCPCRRALGRIPLSHFSQLLAHGGGGQIKGVSDLLGGQIPALPLTGNQSERNCQRLGKVNFLKVSSALFTSIGKLFSNPESF